SDHGQRSPAGNERGRDGGDSERRYGCIERVRGRDPEPREEADEPALRQDAPKAEEEDRPGRRGDGKTQQKSSEQKAEHRIPSWRGHCMARPSTRRLITPRYAHPFMELLRNIWRRKLRSTLTISGIVIGVFALTTMGALAENFNALIDGGVQYFGGSVQVGPPDGQAANLLPISKIDEIKQVQGVEAAFAGYSFTAKPGSTLVVSFGIPDTIVAADPGENAYSALKLTYSSGRSFSAGSRGEVALGYTIAKEFKKKVGDTIDLPVRPADAKPDFVNHTFRVVGLINETKTAPDSFAYINLTDGQMLLSDSLPASLRSTIDTSQITEGISVYGKPGTSLSDLDKIADRINSQVTGVKALRPSDLVNAFKAGGQTFTAITVAAAVIA